MQISKFDTLKFMMHFSSIFDVSKQHIHLTFIIYHMISSLVDDMIGIDTIIPGDIELIVQTECEKIGYAFLIVNMVATYLFDDFTRNFEKLFGIKFMSVTLTKLVLLLKFNIFQKTVVDDYLTRFDYDDNVVEYTQFLIMFDSKYHTFEPTALNNQLLKSLEQLQTIGPIDEFTMKLITYHDTYHTFFESDGKNKFIVILDTYNSKNKGDLLCDVVIIPTRQKFREVRCDRQLSKMSLGSRLGKGQNGTVYSVQENNEEFALKVSTLNSKALNVDSINEIATLVALGDNKYVARLQAYYYDEKTSTFYLLLEKLDFMLCHIKDINDFTESISIGLLTAISNLHEEGFFHRDITFGNFGFIRDRVVFIDFGWGGRLLSVDGKAHKEIISDCSDDTQCRPISPIFRPIELVNPYGSISYDPFLGDIWCCAHIIFYLYVGEPMFYETTETLELIKAYFHNDKSPKYKSQIARINKLRQQMPRKIELLLFKIFQFPSTRITSSEALQLLISN
jgi:hypothetical protein